VTRDLYVDRPEYSFVISRSAQKAGQADHLTAIVRIADSSSIYQQMLKLHRATPERDAESLQGDIKLASWTLTEIDCPAIKVQFGKLQKLRMKPPESRLIVIHPIVHEFRIQASEGKMSASLDNDKHPLAAWGIETRLALERCIKR
jgi:hypothetical protein